MTGNIRAAAFCAALVLAHSPLAGAQASAPRFPAEVTTPVVYQLSSTEDVGTPHVIQCRSRDWRATLRLRFRLKSTGGMVGAEYESVDGTWFAEGSCEGKLTRVHRLQNVSVERAGARRRHPASRGSRRRWMPAPVCAGAASARA